MDNTYREIRKKIVTILKSPASGGKIEDRLTKITIECMIEALTETRQMSYSELMEMVSSLRSELTINTK